jgi:phosphoglycolate phosphatase
MFTCGLLLRRTLIGVIQLVALDMAGTTIDDHGSVYVALQRSVEETGATVAAADLQEWMGTDKVTAIRALMKLGGVEPTDASAAAQFDRFRAILAESYRETPPVALPGVVDALTELRSRGILIALTTGFSDDVAHPLLESLGWTIGAGDEHLLDAVTTTSDVVAGRPAPYMIHHAMERTGVADVRAVLAAGDTIVDLQAARNAGVIAVGVTTGALGREQLAAQPHDHILDGVADIPSLPETQR